MALPADNTQWPPAPFDKAQKEMAGWDAWYTGNTADLAAHYSGTQQTRPSWTGGGLVGAAKTLMWGRPTPPGQERVKLHVPVAADIARTSADLLFAEPPVFLVGEGKSKTQDIMAAMVEGSSAQMLEGAEIQAALGGAYVRLSWDKEMADHVQFTTIHADGAIPEWRLGQLVAATFWQVVERRGKDQVLRYLERHEPGAIEYRLYSGTDDNIGRPIPLTEHPDTAWAAPLVNAEGRQVTGVEGLTVRYVPNILPNRAWRKVPRLAPLGRSDFEQLVPLFDAMDEAYSSMMRELRLGKARAFVDRTLLEDRGPGAGARFDFDQEFFAPMSGLGSLQDGSHVQVEQARIRHEEHRAIIQDILSQILRTAGYSAASFGDDPMVGQMTATEVNSRREQSVRTRNKKIQYWKAALQPLARTALELEKLNFNSQVAVDDVSVRFPTQVSVNPESMAATIAQLSAAEALSTERKVRLQNPNWDSDDVNTEVAKIHRETGREVTDPTKIKE